MKGEASPPAELVEAMARAIRQVDGDHSLGAGALAEALIPALSQAGWVVVRREPTEDSLSRMLEVEAKAISLFRELWPGKSWDGHSVSRSYWRRKARAMLSAGEG